MKLISYIVLVIALGITSAFSQKAVHPAAVTRLRIMSYNVHHCNPPSKEGLIDIDAIAKAINTQQPDLVALQEIDVMTVRSGKLNEATEIAKKTGMKVYFAKAIDHDGGDYGVAILSRYTLSDTKTCRLPSDSSTKGEPRVLAIATVTLPDGRKLLFGCTHLDAQRAETNRLMQIREINRFAAQQKLPFLIAGDLNAHPDSQVIALLDSRFNRTCTDCPFTIPVLQPKTTLDYIAFLQKDKFKVISHEAIPERYASDHLPVLAVIDLLPY